MGLRLSNPSRQAEAAAYAATRMRQPSNGDHAQCKRILDIVVAGAALLFVAPYTGHRALDPPSGWKPGILFPEALWLERRDL